MTQCVPASVDELGIQASLYLWALLIAQERRLPVAPTRRLALLAMDQLHDRGILELPNSRGPWDRQAQARATPIEGLGWRLTWSVYEPDLLSLALEDYFQSIEHDAASLSVRVQLWTELSAAEAERFFQDQLVKHRLPGEWAQDMAFACRDSSLLLTIAQWRYCAWAAVRRGASMALQHSPQVEGLREAIYQELRRRAASVASGAWTGCSFPPHNPVPDTAVALGFVQHLTGLGAQYWTARPGAEPLSRCQAVNAAP